MSRLLAVLAAVSCWRLLVRRPWPGRMLTRPGLTTGHDAPSPRAPRRPDRGRTGANPRRRTPGSSVRRSLAGSGDDPSDLAEVADLLAVALGAGLGPGPALDAVADVAPGPTGRALRRVAAARSRGVPLADSLDVLSDGLGAGGRELATSLRSAAAAGTAAAPALRSLAASARRRSRRRLEVRVRRLPVVLTVPLVLFVLPAFVVLTLVPVALTVAGELREVAWSPVVVAPGPPTVGRSFALAFPLAGPPVPAPAPEGP